MSQRIIPALTPNLILSELADSPLIQKHLNKNPP